MPLSFMIMLHEIILPVTLSVQSKRGRNVSESSVNRNRSASPLLVAPQLSGTALAPVGAALTAAAAPPPSHAPCGSASTVQKETASTTSCGSSAAAATKAVAQTTGRPALQSASTMTSTLSGTDADPSGAALDCHKSPIL